MPHSQCSCGDEEKTPKGRAAIIGTELSRIISLMRKVLKINCNVLEDTEAGSFKAAVSWYHVLSRTYEDQKTQKDKFLYLEMQRNTRSTASQSGNSAPNRPASNVIPLPSREIKTLGLSSNYCGRSYLIQIRWTRGHVLKAYANTSHMWKILSIWSVIWSHFVLNSTANLWRPLKRQIVTAICVKYGKLQFISTDGSS